MAKHTIQRVIKGVGVLAAVVWLAAPVTRFYFGLIMFLVSTAVLFGCFVALRILDDDADGSWWPDRQDPKKLNSWLK